MLMAAPATRCGGSSAAFSGPWSCGNASGENGAAFGNVLGRQSGGKQVRRAGILATHGPPAEAGIVTDDAPHPHLWH